MLYQAGWQAAKQQLAVERNFRLRSFAGGVVSGGLAVAAGFLILMSIATRDADRSIAQASMSSVDVTDENSELPPASINEPNHSRPITNSVDPALAAALAVPSVPLASIWNEMLERASVTSSIVATPIGNRDVIQVRDGHGMSVLSPSGHSGPASVDELPSGGPHYNTYESPELRPFGRRRSIQS